MSGIGDILSSLGGGNSAPGVKSQYYQSMADGTHLVSVMTDGSVQDNGLIASKTAPTDKPVVQKVADGSTWAFMFNPDGTVKSSTKLADGSSTAGATTAHLDAETAKVQQDLADAQAMAPYNKDKASATIANLQSEIQSRTDLDPAKKQQYLASAAKAMADAGIAPSTIAKNTATAALNDAKANQIIAPVWAQAEGELQQLQSSLQAGSITQDQYDQAKQGIINQAIQNAKTGLSSAQQATVNEAAANTFNTQESDKMTSANNRNSTAANLFSSTLSQAQNIAAGMRPGQGPLAAKGFMAMLGAAKQFSGDMGGNAYTPQQNPFLDSLKSATGGGGNTPVGPLQLAQMAQLQGQGMSATDAVKAVAAANGVQLTNDQNQGSGSNPPIQSYGTGAAKYIDPTAPQQPALPVSGGALLG